MCKFKVGDCYHNHSMHITQIKLYLEKPFKNKISKQMKAVKFEREQRQEYTNFLKRAIFSPSHWFWIPIFLLSCFSVTFPVW